tara:strand:+ start:425 stop:652 length:228 start_codon:yes stop_codon:yes gene_type:complete
MKESQRRKATFPLAKSNAQRQKEYRQRQKSKQAVRLDMYLDNDIHYMLEQLAENGGTDMRTVLSTIIKKEYAEQL